MSGNITGDKTELKCPPKKVIDICQDLVDKNKQDFIHPTKENVIQEQVAVIKNVEGESDSDVCIIEEVFGNAVTTLSCNDDITFYDDDSQESQLIVPKKTDDITKIKGWRRKQFFVEKPTTVEFEQLIYPTEKTPAKRLVEQKRRKIRHTSPDNVQNAFVCDSLDEFLEQEAKLKVNYEIPHLFAEVGIKLTKEEIASGPNLSETDIKKIEMKYCRSVPIQSDVINLDDAKTEKVKKAKRAIEDEKEETSFKVVKLEDNNLRLVRVVKKPNEQQINSCSKDTTAAENESKEKILKGLKLDSKKERVCDSEIKLTNVSLGLVVYPCPQKPLHPVVQCHLRKLRSYRTRIDENWANFAASAVVSKDSQYRRFILPTKCCVKVLGKPNIFEETGVALDVEVITEVKKAGVLNCEERENTEKSCDSATQELHPKISKAEIKKMQDCRVVIKKLNTGEGNNSLCVRHVRYNCNECKRLKKSKSILKPIAVKNTEENTIDKPSEHKNPVITPYQLSLDEDITSLLSKKLKVFDPNSLTSIDSLKTLNRNTVELIKIKFIQKSFLHHYVSIWYVKPEGTDVRSRAFLTFTKTPPLPNAINLRSNVIVDDLPKVLREITHPEKSIDPGEYVLLLCNGSFWEIHGSVNVAFNKTMKSTDQVIIPSSLPEMKKLEELSLKLLGMKAFKWCVADLAQKFKDIELKTETLTAVISRKRLLDFSKYKTYGFVPMWTYTRKRVFGTYMIESLLPYVLIGPFYLFETPNISLRGEFLALPFVYKITDTKEGGDLKRHISSTIKETEDTGKAIGGLWLHYKAITDHLCFLEVITKCGVNTLPKSTYSIQEEHGYSLTNNSPPPPPPPPPPLNQDESKDGSSQTEVYVYFDIISLGYVLGMLEKDNSVTIRHPFDEKTKVKSSEIGNWFLGMIRSRIQFVPKNLVVNWFVTKEKSHLKNRQLFNRNFLNGSHILTNAGIFYIFKFGESKNQENTLENHKSVEVVSKDSVIDEVIHLKSLSDLLVKESHTKLNLHRILTMAVNEIIILQEEMNLNQRLRASLEKEKLKLLNTYLIGVQLTGTDNKLKMLLLKQIESVIFKKNGKISDLYLKKLNLYPFGREYLQSLKEPKFIHSSANTILKNSDSPNSVNSHSQASEDKKINQGRNHKEIPIAPKPVESVSKLVDGSLAKVKLNETSNKSDYPVTVSSQIAGEKTKSEKQQEKISPTNEKPRFDLNEKKDSSEKSKEFLKLTSAKLPDNIKLCIRNTSEEKFKKCISLQQNRDAVFETTVKPISTVVEAKSKNSPCDLPTKSVKETNASTNKKGNTSNFDVVSYCKKTDMKVLKAWKNNKKIFFLQPQILFDKRHSSGEKSELEFRKNIKSF